MRMHPGQYAVLKELFVQPFIQEIAAEYLNDPSKCKTLVWYALIGRPDSARVVMRIAKESRAYAALTQLSKLFNGSVDLRSTFASMTPRACF